MQAGLCEFGCRRLGRGMPLRWLCGRRRALDHKSAGAIGVLILYAEVVGPVVLLAVPQSQSGNFGDSRHYQKAPTATPQKAYPPPGCSRARGPCVISPRMMNFLRLLHVFQRYLAESKSFDHSFQSLLVAITRFCKALGSSSPRLISFSLSLLRSQLNRSFKNGSPVSCTMSAITLPNEPNIINP